MNYTELDPTLERLSDTSQGATCPFCSTPWCVSEAEEGCFKGKAFIRCTGCSGNFWLQDVEKCLICEAPMWVGAFDENHIHNGRTYKCCIGGHSTFPFVFQDCDESGAVLNAISDLASMSEAEFRTAMTGLVDGAQHILARQLAVVSARILLHLEERAQEVRRNAEEQADDFLECLRAM